MRKRVLVRKGKMGRQVRSQLSAYVEMEMRWKIAMELDSCRLLLGAGKGFLLELSRVWWPRVFAVYSEWLRSPRTAVRRCDWD
jgi:hypothetical protein